MIDPSIAMGVRMPQLDDPLTVRAKQAQLSDLMSQQQMRQYQAEDAQRARQSEMTLADIYRESGGDPTKTRALMAQRGQGARIPAYDKDQAATNKVMTEADAAKYKLMSEQLDDNNRGMSALLSDPQLSTQKVVQFLASRAQMFPDQAGRLSEVARSLPPDPAQLRQVLMQKAMEGLKAKEQLDLVLPKIETRNLGGVDQVFSTNQLTGQVTPGQSFAKTATPDAVMADARMRSEGAANRGVTMRGQDLVSARAREAAQSKAAGGGAPAKPLPATVVKMQNEAVNALGAFKGLDSDLGALEKQIKDGKLTLGPVSNIVAGARNYVGASNEKSRNLATFKTKLEGMRNAVLLLGKGVQTEGDAARAMDEIIKNINDEEYVKQRLPELRQKIQRDADLQKNSVDLMRSNYGHDPLDYGKFETQPPMVNLPKSTGGATGEWSTGGAPAAPKPGTVQGGYVFRGGNPADPKSWSKQ